MSSSWLNQNILPELRGRDLKLRSPQAALLICSIYKEQKLSFSGSCTCKQNCVLEASDLLYMRGRHMKKHIRKPISLLFRSFRAPCIFRINTNGSPGFGAFIKDSIIRRSCFGIVFERTPAFGLMSCPSVCLPFCPIADRFCCLWMKWNPHFFECSSFILPTKYRFLWLLLLLRHGFGGGRRCFGAGHNEGKRVRS